MIRRTMLKSLAVAGLAAATALYAVTDRTVASEPKDIVETASAAGSFQTLVAAVEAAGLVETLKGEGPFTVFAPTDEAFAALPDGLVDALLLPETVQGRPLAINATEGVTVNDARVVATDVEASNGVIHVIDSVLIPQQM